MKYLYMCKTKEAVNHQQFHYIPSSTLSSVTQHPQHQFPCASTPHTPASMTLSWKWFLIMGIQQCAKCDVMFYSLLLLLSVCWQGWGRAKYDDGMNEIEIKKRMKKNPEIQKWITNINVGEVRRMRRWDGA